MGVGVCVCVCVCGGRGGGGGAGGEEIADAGREEIAGGGVGTADRGWRRRLRGSDLQQTGWLPSTILPFFAPFIVISSDL